MGVIQCVLGLTLGLQALLQHQRWERYKEEVREGVGVAEALRGVAGALWGRCGGVAGMLLGRCGGVQLAGGFRGRCGGMRNGRMSSISIVIAIQVFTKMVNVEFLFPS